VIHTVRDATLRFQVMEILQIENSTLSVNKIVSDVVLYISLLFLIDFINNLLDL
jgi:hypothetical protein